MSNSAPDPQVLEFADGIGSMLSASEIIALKQDSEVTLDGNYDATLVAEFKPTDPAGPAPTTAPSGYTA